MGTTFAEPAAVDVLRRLPIGSVRIGAKRCRDADG